MSTGYQQKYEFNDASKWQVSVDVAKNWAALQDAVILRTGDGVSVEDNLFHEFYSAFRDHGKHLIGAYHFMRPNLSVNGQFDLISRMLDGLVLDFPFWLDMEVNDAGQSPKQIQDFIIEISEKIVSNPSWEYSPQYYAWRDRLYREYWEPAYPERPNVDLPGIYTSPGFWEGHCLINKANPTADDLRFIYYYLWVAHWTSADNPWIPVPFLFWLQWQYDVPHDGPLKGWGSPSIDQNRWNQTILYPRNAGGGEIPPIPEPGPGPTFKGILMLDDGQQYLAEFQKIK